MRARIDIPSLVAGLVVIALGTLLLLDRLEVLDLHFGWLFPALAGAVGAILLAGGLADRSG
ncbi:MAG TPA: hypothetical protein VF533_13265 [Solirubrobacteraceae bacterium]|jgi:hypothetical protein